MMLQQQITSKEIAEKLGIAPSTARVWAKKFKVPRQQQKGISVYTQEAFDVLKTVKEMRDKGSGYNTIQRLITSNDKPVTPLQQGNNTPSESVITAKIEDVITRTLEKSTGLAEKYARATFEIGQLQEQVKNFEAQTKLLPSPIDWALKQSEAKQMANENETLKKELKEQIKRERESEQLLKAIETENQSLKNRSIFARLFNLK